MSEQHLFKFQTENDYKTAMRNHLIIPNISKVVETDSTYINAKFASKESAEAGDIIVYHEESNGEKTVKFMKPEAFDPNDDYWTADAIVVVPFKHTGDGTVRAMALNYASVTNPSEGGNGEEIAWGATANVEGLTQYGGFLVFATPDGQTIEDTIGINNNSECYVSSDAFNAVANPYDNGTYYASNSSENNFVPSPYKNNGSKNDAFYSANDFASFDTNTLQDMDGAKNTLEILKSLDQSSLDQTLYATELDNEQTKSGLNLFPAAAACVRYGSTLKPCSFDSSKTVEENIETMPWYCPSIGEVAYYAARMGKINFALSQIGASEHTLTAIFSSSVGGSKIAAFVSDGYMQYDLASAKKGVIPFCKF